MADQTTITCETITKTDDDNPVETEAETEEGDFYDKSKSYWSTISPTIDGMLGGFAKISPTDIDGSRAFLRPHLKISGGKTSSRQALDCGAGIGRITKRLLLPIFNNVDMVEQNQQFINEAPNFIGPDAKRVEKFICSGLQDFTPESARYDVIWCQWVLGHLKDDDFVDFFRRCRMGLTKNGIIVIKENMTSTSGVDFDEKDNSFTRPVKDVVQLLQKAGLEIVTQQKQKGFPKGLYDVYMFALR